MSAAPSSAPLSRHTAQNRNKREASRRTRRHARRAAMRQGLPPPVHSVAEYLRLPNLFLTLTAVMALHLGDLPQPALDMHISQLGFSDLSSANFDADSRLLCGLGLGFIPTPHFSKRAFTESVMGDTWAFTRRVILHDYFSQNSPPPEPSECPPKFRISNSKWWPTDFNPSSGVLEYCQLLTESVAERLKTAPRTYENLSHDMRTRLESLSSHTGQTFSVADKNLGLTAMDTCDYKACCLKWLARTHTVVDYGLSLSDTVTSVIQVTINALKTVFLPLLPLLPKWMQKWLTHHTDPGLFRAAAFRALPKLHKARIIGELVDTRPITGNHCWATQPAALLIAFLLMPLVRVTTSFCKDSDSFIRELSTFTFSHHGTLFSFDVEKLYPSILHGHCVSTIRAYLLSKRFRYTLLVCNLLAVVLAYNFCQFDNVLYHQHTGFATGVACGSEVANIYLAALESRNLRLYIANLSFFKRYIDDGFGVWLGSLALLRIFLNQLYEGSGLNITIEIDSSSMIFLDMIVFKHSDFRITGQLDFRCYQKPTNAYLYLPYTSAHPPHVWHAFIKGELMRYVKRCSRISDFAIMKMRFWIRLLNRGYPHAVLRKSFSSVSFHARSSYLLEKLPTPTPSLSSSSSRSQTLPLVLTYSKQLVDNNLHTLFSNNLRLLTHHPHFSAVRIKINAGALPLS